MKKKGFLVNLPAAKIAILRHNIYYDFSFSDIKARMIRDEIEAKLLLSKQFCSL
ncbi:hypothetical protein MACH16_15920 [Marinomonas pontica]|uniref:Uncharacterized protein n=1 Tax=Marinomonas pontica TaxID=264739 RepID=A0ABM8FCP7_9GAMM|nr:hypothetical protein MACH16_15920 [Marinomonas pontica]